MTDYKFNIKVFNKNRELAMTRFKTETEEIITRVYSENEITGIEREKCIADVSFDKKDTITSALSLISQGYKVCALNFADAYHVGGLVKAGASTQEEDLCRCSNLYESLSQEQCWKDYYEYNKSNSTLEFTDRCIYTKGVLIFRTSGDYKMLKEPVKCDIISCPAPIGVDSNDYIETVYRRARHILNIVTSNDIDAVVLGAWGCGVFDGNPEIVGKAFAKAIEEYPYFKKVVFSVKSLDSDVRDNFKLLKSGFNSVRKV